MTFRKPWKTPRVEPPKLAAQPPWTDKFSLVSRGSRYQVRIAMLLMGVLPVLVLGFLVVTFMLPAGTFSVVARSALGGTALVLAVSGYAMLHKYPQNIVKLRQYLRNIAEGELPDKVTLEHTEDDLGAIETYLNQVLSSLRDKVTLLERQLQLTHDMKAALEAQQQELLEAERQRVMIQSLGAACHHIGQPTTVLGAHLYLLKGQSPPPAMLASIEECERAVESIAGVLEKLRQVSDYRTMPYRTVAADKAAGADSAILDIEAALGHGLTPPKDPPTRT